METSCGTQSGYGNAQSVPTFSWQRSGSGRKMESMEKLTEQLSAVAPFIGTALAGCLLQALKTRWQGWKNFAASAASAGFGAWLVFQLVDDVLSTGWGIFASGMIGYSGGSLVDVALAAFSRKADTVIGGHKDTDAE